MRNTLLTLAVVAAVATPAAAQELATQGAGTALCSKITELYRRFPNAADVNATDLMVESWSSGFMSATNLARAANGNDTHNLATLSVPQQVLAIRRYCKHNPTQTVMAAVMVLFNGFTSNADAAVVSQDTFK